MYSSLVKLYANKLYPIDKANMFKQPEHKLEFLKRRNRHLSVFMAITAPVITLVLLKSVNHSIFESININLNNHTTNLIDQSSDIINSQSQSQLQSQSQSLSKLNLQPHSQSQSQSQLNSIYKSMAFLLLKNKNNGPN